MMIELVELQQKVRRKYLKHGRMLWLVETEKFEEAWGLASDQDKTVATTLIEALDKEGLKRWRDALVITEFDDLSVAKLREVAATRCVYNYSRLPKAELIAAIRETYK